jgi:class 3 adenylate cyclase
LLIAAISFSKLARNLVLVPLEAIFEKMKAIAKNPMAAISEGYSEAGIMTFLKNKQKQDKGKGSKGTKGEYETDILDNTIMQIGKLLAIGFGEAGCGIISDNIAQGEDVNPMIAGKKIIAFFGFCDIRDFTDTTEELETHVMVFVNTIADIVHSCVHKHNGAANKNIGDAFLLVWKINKSDLINVDNKLEIRPNTSRVKYKADLAVFSFLRIIAKINTSASVLKYNAIPALQQRMPHFAVKMGFGLHVGWAIEGAIGSFYKIDASYLSPNVNMASRLEAATKQYGVPLLLSGAVYKELSKFFKAKCRKIDNVTVKGSAKPISLYTIDLKVNRLKSMEKTTIHSEYLSPEGKRQEREGKRKKLMLGIRKRKITTMSLFKNEKYIQEMRRSYEGRLAKHFYFDFTCGFTEYLHGNWEEAHRHFKNTLNRIPNDGPTQTLINYITSKNYIPPSDWKGFRELTEK